MGTTTDKLNRLTQTKSDLKTVINYSGANITDETTFKEYPKKLHKSYIDILNNGTDDLYDELPKTTDSGSSLDLNTEEGKMKLKLNSTQLTQTTTPSVNSPQNIHVITGTNNILLLNKNLIKCGSNVNRGITFKFNQTDGSMSFSGRATGTFANSTRYKTGVLDAGEYVWSKTIVSGTQNFTLGIRMYFEDGTYVGNTMNSSTNSKKITFSKKVTSYYVYISGLTENTTVVNCTLKTQLEKGDIATDFLPYQEQNYPITLSSNNLINYTTLIDGYVSSNGTFAITHANDEMRSDFIKVTPNTNYVFEIVQTSSTYDNWFGVGEYTSNSTSTFVIRDTMTTTTQNYIQFMTSATTNYIVVSARNLASATKIQLEEGETTTTYTPYIANPIEYCKIGNVEDEISNKFISDNLFDFDNISVSRLGNDGTVNVENNIITFTATGQSVYGVTIDLADLNLKNNTTYTVSNLFTNTGTLASNSGWRYYDGSTYTTLNNYQTYFTFTTTESGTNQLLYYVGSPVTYTGTLTLYNIQLLEGNITQANIPAYIPYIVKGDWYLKKNIKKYTGTWRKGGTQSFSDSNIFYSNDTDALGSGFTPICTHLPYYRGIYSNNEIAVDRFTSSNELGIRLPSTLATTAEGVDTWFSDNNVKIYYPTKTSSYIHLTDENYPVLLVQLEDIYNNVKSYDKKTLIGQVNDDLSFTLDASALAKIE